MSHIFGPSKWKTFDGNRLITLPEKPGVYVFLWNLSGYMWPAYIGSSRNMRARVQGHMKRKFDPNSERDDRPWPNLIRDGSMVCKYRETERLGDWLMIEARLIHQLRPEFNKSVVLKGMPHGRRRSMNYGIGVVE